MFNYDFDFQLDDFMLYCRTNQLRPKTMASYEQTLRLFQRWLKVKLRKICHFSAPFLVISQPDRISFCVPTILTGSSLVS